MDKKLNLVWFRRDLRVRDNAIVSLATVQGPCLFFFVLDEWFLRQSSVASKRVQFLFESLQGLDAELRRLGSQLHIFVGESREVLRQLGRESGERGWIPTLWFGRDVQEVYGLKRDAAVREFYEKQGWECREELTYFLLDDESRMDRWRQEYYAWQNADLYTLGAVQGVAYGGRLQTLEPADLFTEYPEFASTYAPGVESLFVGGTRAGYAVLESFLASRYRGYHWRMSRPWESQQGGSSHLSAHIAFGTVSAREAYQRNKRRSEELLAAGDKKGYFALRAWRDRLRWRDSFTQRLYFFPELKWENKYQDFDEVYNRAPLTGEQKEWFELWTQGRTGFPMVDASMRQLNAQGWMNFRTRAMNATFLTLILGVSWQYGAEYFLRRLVDGDIAINNWQWQAQAGATNPGGKTMRLYDPRVVLRRKDPEAKYVRHWIEELRPLPATEILAHSYPRTNYPAEIVYFEQQKATVAKRVASIRARVRERMLLHPEEFAPGEAQRLNYTLRAYRGWKRREYKRYVDGEEVAEAEALF